MSHRIISQRLTIKLFVEDNITDEYLGWLNDRELMRYSRQRLRVHTRESCEDYLRGFANSSNFFWNIARREDGGQVGTITAYVDSISRVADIGLMIGHQSVGYGGEAFGVCGFRPVLK